MFRGLARLTVRSYSSSSAKFAEAAAPGASLLINFNTPHAPVLANTSVKVVVLPGESGEFGLTAGHSPIIAQLKPGVVTVTHDAGNVEKFFIPGGWAIANPDKTEISVPEAFSLADFDEQAVKSGYAEAVKAQSSNEPATKAAAQVEAETFSILARALGITL